MTCEVHISSSMKKGFLKHICIHSFIPGSLAAPVLSGQNRPFLTKEGGLPNPRPRAGSPFAESICPSQASVPVGTRGMRGLGVRCHFFQLNPHLPKVPQPPKTVLPARDQVFKHMYPVGDISHSNHTALSLPHTCEDQAPHYCPSLLETGNVIHPIRTTRNERRPRHVVGAQGREPSATHPTQPLDFLFGLFVCGETCAVGDMGGAGPSPSPMCPLPPAFTQ